MPEQRGGALDPGDERAGQQPEPEVTVVWVDSGQSTSGPPPSPGDPTPRRRSLVVGVVVATLVLAAIVIGVALNSVRTADQGTRTGGGATADATSTQSQGDPASSPTSAAPPPSASTSPSASKVPPKPRSRLDPPAAVRGRVKVVRPTPGVDDCGATDRPSGYKNYPAGECRFFENTKGLRTKEKASKGPITVACQRDLKRENKINRFGGTNTWWVWTTSDDGTWDWFPETSVDEGASDKPIGGVALCR